MSHTFTDIGRSETSVDRASPDSPATGDPDLARQQGQALLDAADAAIERALSRDSGLFLAQGRQTGGQ